MALEQTPLCQKIIALMIVKIPAFGFDISRLMYRSDVMKKARCDEKSSIATDWDGEYLKLWPDVGLADIAEQELTVKFFNQLPGIVQKYGYKIIYASDTTIVLQQE